MSNLGRPILSVFVALAGTASAQTTPVAVQVYVQVQDQAGLQPAALHEFVRRTGSILVGAGLSIQVKVCNRSVEVSCETQTGSARRLVIRVVAAEAKTMRGVRGFRLGTSFADHEGGTYATVFLSPVRDQAARQNFSWVTILAYAAAHEIGHLLLGNQAHTPRGLMKAKWGREDYEGMSQNRCLFSDEQVRDLTKRYGSSRQADPGSDAEFKSHR